MARRAATVTEAREHPELVADKSIDDEIAHYTEIIGCNRARLIPDPEG